MYSLYWEAHTVGDAKNMLTAFPAEGFDPHKSGAMVWH